ncbi:MAG: imidazole glycerol phosphate synthase subunit HisH [Flavobacterium sp.]|uniref:imidazole glycerol phosphate synthase subunit HisH n=1 Tax=Flavobacterium sp. TaxID=239 RepID=UPI00121E8E68|nr:imidazole glycerol phosphate synthase subunit HisH [Flavobacterium sp.]RZJ66237.1 MAG: imidazole glycerol phosphate synthase subunit HisH [Flavobacterium sp.]
MIAILDYGAGNAASVQNAVNRLGYETLLTRDAKFIASADKVIFPGVGQAASAMENLKNQGLNTLLPELEQPVLGICLGLQLMCEFSQEGNTDGLSIFKTRVAKFPETGIVPHMGWNSVDKLDSVLFDGISDGTDFYFVHSYFAPVSENTSARCDYLTPFSAALERDNFYAVQFHPEKSGIAGQQLLKNFLEL